MAIRGFTLIEILIATAIGALLIALVATTLLGVRKVVDRNLIMSLLHENASILAKDLGRDIGSSLPGAKWELRADPGADGWGSGDERLSLTWMTTISDPQLTNYELLPGPRHDLVWCRLLWVGGGASGRPMLYYAQSSPFRRYSAGSTRIQQDPLMRRDRRRDLDDNDLRFIPGIDHATWSSIAMPGDSADLDQDIRRKPLHAPLVSAADVVISWRDRDGWTYVASAASGVRQYDPGGAAVALAGGPWDNDQCFAVDGVYLDARPGTAPGMSRTIAGMRPLLVRLRCRLVDGVVRTGGAEQASLDLALSFATGPDLPAP